MESVYLKLGGEKLRKQTGSCTGLQHKRGKSNFSILQTSITAIIITRKENIIKWQLYHKRYIGSQC